MKTQLMIVGLLVLGITYGVQGGGKKEAEACDGKKEGDPCSFVLYEEKKNKNGYPEFTGYCNRNPLSGVLYCNKHDTNS